MLYLALLSATLACHMEATQAFYVVSRQRQPSSIIFSAAAESENLGSVIAPDNEDFKFDEGLGGVRLAQESVIKICGQVKHKPGSASPQIAELVRYKSITSVKPEALAASNTVDSIVCTGMGSELYRDPGETVDEQVTLAPLDAVRDALQGAGSAMKASKLIINFAGGEDAQVSEVMDATKQIVLALDVPTKAKISFNSISHSTFPKGTSTLTVVALGDTDDDDTDKPKGDVNKALASGEIYFRDGGYWTCEASEINTAIA